MFTFDEGSFRLPVPKFKMIQGYFIYCFCVALG